MKSSWFRSGARVALALAGIAALAVAALPAQAAPFNGRRAEFVDDAFRTVWTRTDDTGVRGGRTWYWGPQPWFDYAEFYRQGVNGLRTVQYFDKARMEINNPFDRSFQGGVTNGLLVVELVSGHLKKGNDPVDFENLLPADVPVAGNPKADNPDSPTYASFAAVATFDNNAYKDQSRLNQRVGATLDRAGNLGYRQDLADAFAETTIVQYNSATGHNIPRVFWDFMTMEGPVIEGGQAHTRPIVDWLFAMGLPISDPYWMRAKVGTAEKDVLVQLFERRALTFVPDNPAGFKVEMGNVGQHYFQWRYPNLGQPWAAGEPTAALLYGSNAANSEFFELWRYADSGSAQFTGDPLHPVTRPGTNSLPFSLRRSFEPTSQCAFYDSPRGDGTHRQLYQLPVLPGGFAGEFANTCLPERLTYSDSTPTHPTIPATDAQLQNANDYNPSISPDGTKLAFVSDRYGTPQIYLMRADGSTPALLTPERCVSEHPSWGPDGRSLVWQRRCGQGRVAIVKGDLKYDEDGSFGIYAALVNVRELTDQGSDNLYPRVAPGGTRIAFTSYRDSNAEIYLMNADGSAQTRLTTSPGDDKAATWSADGRQLAFASNRDGDYDIYLMNADGSGQTALTANDAEDNWPSWAQ
jgi:hypothetical protein